MYDNELGRPLKSLDFVDRFVKCYDLNVESVCKQYNDNPENYKDDDEYLDDYTMYFKYGERIFGDTLRMMDVVWDMIHFSRSVNYQIEDAVCNEVVMSWFNLIISKLTQVADLNDMREQWGHFSLGLDKEKALL